MPIFHALRPPSPVLRRCAAVLAIALTAALGVWVIAGQPVGAFAAPTTGAASAVQVGWTDSAKSGKAFDAGTAAQPLGSHVDSAGTVHTSRDYATYDINQFIGKHFVSASLTVNETTATDCSVRAIEVWSTKVVSATPTWKNAPNELTKQDEITTPEFCPTAQISFDVSAAVSTALTKNQARVTFEIRVPETHETDPAYGRTISPSVFLRVRYNSVPTVDSATLTEAGRGCGSKNKPPTVGAFADELQAVFDDADSNDTLTGTFAAWPVTDPSAIITATTQFVVRGNFSTAHLPAGTLVDGTTYAWHAEVSDGFDTSPWSKTCYFQYDGTAPSAPTITSTNYPASGADEFGPVGVAAQFVLSAHGDTDVAAFEWGWEFLSVPGCQQQDRTELVCPDPLSGPNIVKLKTAGGTANLKISPPRSFENTLVVRTLDRAGNRSSTTTYQIDAPITDAGVQVVGGQPQWNTPVTLTFSPAPGVRNVTSYDYTLDFESGVSTVDAAADGTATITFQAVNTFGYQISVHSHSSNGFISTPGTLSIFFDPWAGVTSDIYLEDSEPHGGVGVTGTFTFTPPPGFLQVQEYRYLLPGASDFQTVTANPDNTATITFTPDISGPADLLVYAVAPDGTVSDNANDYFFVVADS